MSACERVLAIHHPLFIFVCSFTARAVAPCGHASGSVFDARMHSTLGALMRGCGRDGLKQAGTEEVLRRAYRHAVVLADARTHRRVNAGDSKHLILARTRTHLHASGHGTAVEAPRVKDGFVGKSACRAADGTEQTSGHPVRRHRPQSARQRFVIGSWLTTRSLAHKPKYSTKFWSLLSSTSTAIAQHVARGAGNSARADVEGEGKEGRGARERRVEARGKGGTARARFDVETRKRETRARGLEAAKRNPSPRAGRLCRLVLPSRTLPAAADKAVAQEWGWKRSSGAAAAGRRQ